MSSKITLLETGSTPGADSEVQLRPTVGRKSLAGCTASVDFTLSLIDRRKSPIQSPVYVDP